MKKFDFRRLMLMLLPLAAVGLATTNNSVMILDTLTGTAVYHSYFDLAELERFRMAAPMAAMLSIAAGVLAAVYLGAKKHSCLRAVVWVSFLAATAAVLPVLGGGETKVVPNVMLPILMLIEAALAYVMSKKPIRTDRPDAPRLERH
ncbi:MAG: hypothetical protein Q4F17_09240 [Eubacteriales bacterium]|nr:hypothetical protein [Eubacteriales bacterium]